MEKCKLTKRDIDSVRHMEGFPNGSDDDIIALSDAPYYTACPNPFMSEFIAENGKPYDEGNDEYQREPFSSDVSEGKKEPIYNAHNYHTKVPYKAIMRYILHYTNPGDIVFDGFCGTGMTGVAAQMCGSEDAELQYAMLSTQRNATWGTRKAIVSDLSPVAAFIASNYNSTIDSRVYEEKATSILDSFFNIYGWMYETLPSKTLQRSMLDSDASARINYTVWSDVFICPSCSNEFVFYDVATQGDGSVAKEFSCPHCNANLGKRSVKHAMDVFYDDLIGETVTIAKQKPVLINYTWHGKSYDKPLDEQDLSLIERIKSEPVPFRVPTSFFPQGDKTDEPKRLGMNRIHQVYQRRNLIALSYFYNEIEKIEDASLRSKIRFTFEQLLWGMAKFSRYVPTHYSQVNQYLNGTLFIGSQVVEASPSYILNNKIHNLTKVFGLTRHFSNSDVIVSTTSLVQTTCPDECVDYIFTDPPFGSNLMYSELNFIIEAWNRVLTNNQSEAIMNDTQKKKLLEYQDLMTACFKEYYRVLKPNRWMTVEFHNSKNAIWNAIQEALNRAGFIIADVRTLDKNQGSFNQVKGASQAIKQDLIISAYKPKNGFAKEFRLKAGSEKTVWSFVRQHLSNLPITVKRGGQLEVLAERQAYLLWDRTVAYHIMKGVAVPMDATEFFRGLDDNFLKRDNMYFLPSQVNKYDKARATCDVENIQFSMFVSDEKSAIGWLYQQLDSNSGDGPQPYADLMPKFMQELKAVDKREKMPELITILEENFLKDEKGRWYIPDLTKSGDIAKLREKNLLKEFQQYMESKGKLKVFRSEAIRAGFAMLWKEKNYAAIVAMAERLPEETIQEDPNLLMYYDISLSRV